MGFSTPKPRFNLVDFLNEKATPAARRRPTWKRQPLPEAVETDAPEAEAETDAETESEDTAAEPAATDSKG